MAAGEGRELHGMVVPDWMQPIIDATNKLRYGVSEEERMRQVQGETIPGIRDAAYTAPLKLYDPAAAERYGSAYLFAQMYPRLQLSAHALTRVFRGIGSHIVPGMGPERPELVNAEYLGMKRGSATPEAAVNDILTNLMLSLAAR